MALKGLLRQLVQRSGMGSYRFRYDRGLLARPNYAYLVFQAAQLAARLRLPRVSVVEFGVAGGSGLVSLEQHAAEVERIFPVKIEIYGFDTGAGLPPPADYRDLPYHWQAGFFKMDVPALQSRLTRSKLVFGEVSETIHSFFDKHDPAPVGAVSHDMDYYSSTLSALKLFDADPSRLLPRVVCYFDDIIGGDMELYNDFVGQRLAIHQFNSEHAKVKLSPIYYLTCRRPDIFWHHQMFSAHFFEHPLYSRFISAGDQQLPV
ncbi:MAG TPA: hypothetical protein VGN43_16310 [Steroidobacteraceae bacterium]|jgi:hypothetical protein|nr:hypothetical protein [Steroidobacteraceae bacterium]